LLFIDALDEDILVEWDLTKNCATGAGGLPRASFATHCAARRALASMDIAPRARSIVQVSTSGQRGQLQPHGASAAGATQHHNELSGKGQVEPGSPEDDEDHSGNAPIMAKSLTGGCVFLGFSSEFPAQGGTVGLRGLARREPTGGRKWYRLLLTM
jgi:hypothetical protein